MLNGEKYKRQILDIIKVGNGTIPGVKNNKPVYCGDVDCPICQFQRYDCTEGGCNLKFMEWALSEYVRPAVDWMEVSVDTPICVRDSEDEDFIPAHFAKYLEESDTVVAWVDGRTSHTTPDIKTWRFAILAEDL